MATGIMVIIHVMQTQVPIAFDSHFLETQYRYRYRQ